MAGRAGRFPVALLPRRPFLEAFFLGSSFVARCQSRSDEADRIVVLGVADEEEPLAFAQAKNEIPSFIPTVIWVRNR